MSGPAATSQYGYGQTVSGQYASGPEPVSGHYVRGPYGGIDYNGTIIGQNPLGGQLISGTNQYGTVAHGGSGVRAEEIPVESRIEYIPFEKKYIEYDKVERIERIPVEREIIEYEEVVHNERVPVERTITDYYAVETQVEYIPKEIEETVVEYEAV